VRLRPFWQYVHGDSGTPRIPRPQHLAWDGLILRWDDPFWDTHFPPNDWLCSCGVHSLSRGDLRRLGKDGPDTAPEIIMDTVLDKVTGKEIQKPRGIGYGWDYQPGNLWEQGLVPSALEEEAGGLSIGKRHAVEIDKPEPIEDLIKTSKPFKAEPLPEGLEPEDYVRGFLDPFGADIGHAVLWEDKAGMLSQPEARG
jgi:hypothetical protein